MVKSGIIITQYYFIDFCWGAGIGTRVADTGKRAATVGASGHSTTRAGLPIGRMGTTYLLLHALNSWLRLIFF